MEDVVECAECHNRYDSQAHPFCPRCGSEDQEAPVRHGSYRPQSFDPRRRRAQIGGIILITMGALSIVLYATVMALVGGMLPDHAGDLLAGEPGGGLSVFVSNATGPAAGATIVLTDHDGAVVANGTTDAFGYWNVSLERSAAVFLNASHGQSTWQREVLSLQGQTTRVALGPDNVGERDGWLGTGVLVGPVRMLLGFFILVAAFVVLGGISAVRLRQKGLAITAGVVGLMPVLIIGVAVPSIGSILLLLLMGLALGFIVMGRGHFE